MLRLRFDDFSRATRSHTIERATAHTDTILAVARGLLAAEAATIARRGLTLIGISVANLDDQGSVQLVLPFDRRAADAVDAAIDEIRRRYGRTAITRAVLLGRDTGLTVPLLPD